MKKGYKLTFHGFLPPLISLLYVVKYITERNSKQHGYYGENQLIVKFRDGISLEMMKEIHTYDLLVLLRLIRTFFKIL